MEMSMSSHQQYTVYAFCRSYQVLLYVYILYSSFKLHFSYIVCDGVHVCVVYWGTDL